MRETSRGTIPEVKLLDTLLCVLFSVCVLLISRKHYIILAMTQRGLEAPVSCMKICRLIGVFLSQIANSSNERTNVFDGGSTTTI